MDKQKQWIALSLAGCLAVLAAGWVLLVSPKRADAADLRLAVATQEQQNASLRTQLQALAAQARDLPAQQAQIAEAARRIPSGASLPTLLRDLQRVAGSTGVDLLGVSPSTPAPVAAGGATAVPGPSSGLSSVPVAVRAVGTFYALQQFLAGLEDLTRATRVTALTLAPGQGLQAPATAGSVQDGRTLEATLSLQVYLSGATTTAATPAGAATAATAAATGVTTTAAAPTTAGTTTSTAPATGSTVGNAVTPPSGTTTSSGGASVPTAGSR